MKDFDGARPERSSAAGQARRDDRVYLHCVRRTVRIAAVLGSPDLMDAVVEDTCLRIAEQDWSGRLPARRHRTARARWCAEGEYLRRENQRVRAAADRALAEAPDARAEDC